MVTCAICGLDMPKSMALGWVHDSILGWMCGQCEAEVNERSIFEEEEIACETGTWYVQGDALVKPLFDPIMDV